MEQLVISQPHRAASSETFRWKRPIVWLIDKSRTALLRRIVLTQMATVSALLCLAMTSNLILAVLLFLDFSAILWMSSPGLYTLLMSEVPAQEWPPELAPRVPSRQQLER